MLPLDGRQLVPLYQSAILSGNPLHADRVDRAAGCMSQICEVAVRGPLPRCLDSDLCML